MNRKQYSKNLVALTLIAAFALAAGISAAQPGDNSTATDFNSFQVIAQRNIFDPNRYPQERRDFQHPRPNSRVPAFSLAGTMSYRNGMFAFFDGTDSDYQKVLQEGGTIAGYTVTNITMTGVQLLAGGTNTVMIVGASMQQEGDSWVLNSPAQGTMSSTTDTGDSSVESPSSNTPPPASPGSGGEQNDILKKLMEQRAQELK